MLIPARHRGTLGPCALCNILSLSLKRFSQVSAFHGVVKRVGRVHRKRECNMHLSRPQWVSSSRHPVLRGLNEHYAHLALVAEGSDFVMLRLFRRTYSTPLPNTLLRCDSENGLNLISGSRVVPHVFKGFSRETMRRLLLHNLLEILNLLYRDEGSVIYDICNSIPQPR